MNNNHNKKMVAPVIITAVVLLYLIVYLVAVAMTTGFSPRMLLFSIPLIALGDRNGIYTEIKNKRDKERRRR